MRMERCGLGVACMKKNKAFLRFQFKGGDIFGI